MIRHATSAKSQGVDTLHRWNYWCPFKAPSKTKWLLLSGALDPPRNINISKRRPREAAKSGKYLHGITQDIHNMSIFITSHPNVGTLHDRHSTMKTTTKQAKERITEILKDSENVSVVIYYTGHGESGTGNWCFADGTLSFSDIADICNEHLDFHKTHEVKLLVIADACFSGIWADYLSEEKSKNIRVLAAAPYCNTALDYGYEGGELTQFLLGELTETSRTPIFGSPWSNDETFPYERKCENIEDFLYSHLDERNNELVSFTVANGKFSAIFRHAESTDTLTYKYDFAMSPEDCLENIKDNQSEGYFMTEIVNDGGKFHIVYQEGSERRKYKMYGEGVVIFYNDSKILQTKKLDKNGTLLKELSQNSFYFAQEIHSFPDLERLIKYNEMRGKRIESISYNSYSRHYEVIFILDDDVPGHLDSFFFKEEEYGFAKIWMRDQINQGFEPYLIFKDPRTNQILLCVRKISKPNSCPSYKTEVAIDFTQFVYQ